MKLHKNTRLLPYERQAIWLSYTQEKVSVTALARQYNVSRPTILYKVACWEHWFWLFSAKSSYCFYRL